METEAEQDARVKEEERLAREALSPRKKASSPEMEQKPESRGTPALMRKLRALSPLLRATASPKKTVTVRLMPGEAAMGRRASGVIGGPRGGMSPHDRRGSGVLDGGHGGGLGERRGSGIMGERAGLFRRGSRAPGAQDSMRRGSGGGTQLNLEMLGMGQTFSPKVIFVPSPRIFPCIPRRISDVSLAYLIVYLMSDSVLCKLV